MGLFNKTRKIDWAVEAQNTIEEEKKRKNKYEEEERKYLELHAYDYDDEIIESVKKNGYYVRQYQHFAKATLLRNAAERLNLEGFLRINDNSIVIYNKYLEQYLREKHIWIDEYLKLKKNED